MFVQFWAAPAAGTEGVTFGECCVDPFWLAFANLDAERISYFRAAVKPFAKKFPVAFAGERMGRHLRPNCCICGFAKPENRFGASGDER